MLEQLRTRKRELGGFGLVDNGTPGQWDYILADERAKGKNRSEKLCMKWIEKWEGGCFGVILRSIFCGPLRSQSWKSLEDEMLFVAESPEAMQVAMEKRVHPNALPVKQQHQVALIANLLFNMTRPDVENRANVGKAHRHPAISQRVWSPAQCADLNGGGTVLSSRMGPPGSPWEGIRFPAWRLAPDGPDGSWGIGAFSEEDLNRDTFAALYLGIYSSLKGGPSEGEWAPGRNNVSLFRGDGTDEFAMGEMPFEILLEQSAPGIFFNSQSPSNANMVLDHKTAWVDTREDWKGAIWMVLKVMKTKQIHKGEPGYWNYDLFAGGGGSDAFTFNDAAFHIERTQV